ncbi:hypothetical protein ACLEPN_07080 [Myxococcus sp. 1LA]
MKPAAAVNVASTSVSAAGAQGAGAEQAASDKTPSAAPLPRESGEGAAGVTHGR